MTVNNQTNRFVKLLTSCRELKVCLDLFNFSRSDLKNQGRFNAVLFCCLVYSLFFVILQYVNGARQKRTN